MDYSKLSNDEINKAVALLCTIEGIVINDDGEPVRNILDDSPGSYSGGDYMEVDFDPCNNPADAWPIILKNKISIKPVKRVRNYNEYYDSWEAGGICALEEHDNPLRAAMIVFLVMQE